MNPITRKICTEFAKTFRLVRLTDREYLDLFDEDAREEDLWVGAGVGALVAVSKKAYAESHLVTARTVQNWVANGMPVLKDGMVPVSAANAWKEHYDEHVRERRSWGRRPEGVSW